MWEPKYSARKVRGPPCQVLQDHSSWDLQEIERGLLCPLYICATWDLMPIIRINMSPLGTRWETFHQHMVRSRVSFLLVRTHPTTAVSKKWHLNHAEKWSFLLDFKKLFRKLIPQFLSLRRFSSLECFQMRNTQTITEANIWSTHYGPGPVPYGFLKPPPFILPSTLEVGITLIPIFRWGNPGPERWSILSWVTWLANLKIWLLIHASLSPKPTHL